MAQACKLTPSLCVVRRSARIACRTVSRTRIGRRLRHNRNVTDWAVALISGGAALLGATVGAATQVRLQRQAFAQQKNVVDRDRRHDLYRNFSRFVMDLQHRMRDALVSGSYTFEAEVTREFDAQRADLVIDATPEARAAVDGVRAAIVAALNDFESRARLDLQKPVEQRLGVHNLTRQLFEERVVPRLYEAADVMQKEI